MEIGSGSSLEPLIAPIEKSYIYFSHSASEALILAIYFLRYNRIMPAEIINAPPSKVCRLGISDQNNQPTILAHNKEE